jgi:hypothetical protein
MVLVAGGFSALSTRRASRVCLLWRQHPPTRGTRGCCRHQEGRQAAALDRRRAAREQRELLDELAPKATAGTHEARVRTRRLLEPGGGGGGGGGGVGGGRGG